MTRILFVCLGNICRSPTAQGVFEKLITDLGQAEAFEVDSAGTHAYHVGSPPDGRATAAAARRGIDLSLQRARVVDAVDFERFGHIVAMDRSNLSNLKGMAPAGHSARLWIATEFATDLDYQEVPDPYYGGDDGFEQVLDLLEVACQGLLEHVSRR